MDARWASDISDDDDDGDFLVLEIPPILRGSVAICSFEGTPNPRLKVCGGVGTQR